MCLHTSFLSQSWSEFVQEVDPDILTGYNIINFDLPYLLNRARSLKVFHFPFLGRIVDSPTTMRTSTFESKAYGKRENKVITIEGRVQFDLLPVRKGLILHVVNLSVLRYCSVMPSYAPTHSTPSASIS